MTLRRAAVAGTWYPATAARLAAQVEGYVAQAATGGAAIPNDADIVALISPHAGLMYSGPVAAYGYDVLRSRQYETIVLVGPSHYVGFEGAAIWPTGAFETPLGNLAIDAVIATKIQSLCPIVEERPAAHQREHSLEMQLPFLASFASETPIVPIIMGFQTRDTAFALGDAIATALRGRHALLVASSDLSHFYDAETAAALDTRVIEQVEALDDEGLMTLLEQRADHACGGGPMVSVLRAARLLGGKTSRVLRYADSGDVSGDKDSVVGYMAAAVWR
jgi:AmmeMemoRadiSam system protein B